MLVNYYILQKLIDVPTSVDIIYEECGTNLPPYNVVNESDVSGCIYLFCVDSAVDVKSICNKYNYLCNFLVQYEVEDSLYDKTSTIVVSTGAVMYNLVPASSP